MTESGTFRRLVVAVAALLALTAATAATAAPASPRAGARFDGRPSSTAVRFPTRVTRTLPVRAAGETRRAVLRAVARATPGSLAADAYSGFAYCGDDEAYFWPVDAPGHDMTVTRTHFVHSTSGTFADAVVESSPDYIVQVGPDFYAYNIEWAEVWGGPWSYFWSWLWYDQWENTDYLAFVNEVVYVDNGTASTSTFELLDVVGPTITSANVCRP